jgi:hypothetical protein
VHQLALRGGAWLEPGDDLAFRERLPAVVHKLDARRVILRGKLRAAKTRRGQARFAKRLSRAYGNAAASLAPVLPAKGPAVQAVAAMQGSAAAHKDLAAAARNGWPQRYKRAKRSVKRKEAALARALAATR